MRYSFQSTGRPFPVHMISHRNKILAPVQQPGWARAGMTWWYLVNHGEKISSSEYKTDMRSSLAKNLGEKEGEPAKGESRLFQSNNLSYADIN